MGGPKIKEVGGGPARGLADDWVNFLRGGITTGSFGAGSATQQANNANPFGSTIGIAGVLNDILSGGAGTLGGSLNELISRSTENQAKALRSQFSAGGGSAYGTPAAYAEAVLRSQQAPALANAVGGLQLNALSQLFPMISGLAGKGIAQRETIAQPSTFSSVVGSIAPLIGAGLNFFAPGVGSAVTTAAAPFALKSASFQSAPNYGIPSSIDWSKGFNMNWLPPSLTMPSFGSFR